MSTKRTYHDKRAAITAIGEALAIRGWTLWGYRADQSDAMTDYYSPASWSGIATKGDRVAVVGDVEARLSGFTPEPRTVRERGGDCARCGASGADPELPTLAEAQADPHAYHVRDLILRHPGAVEVEGAKFPTVRDPNGNLIGSPLGARVVSPLHFQEAKPHRAKCIECHGLGHGWHTHEEPQPTWPKFHHANPKGGRWHVEQADLLIESGGGFYCIADAHGAEAERWADKFALQIDTAGLVREGAPALPAGAGCTISPSSIGREGFIEVRFPAKPDDGVRLALKGAGFRWAKSSGCWYGPAEQLPKILRAA